VLAALRGRAIDGRFLVDELHGQALPRVLRAAAVVVRCDARRQVLRDARIERPVSTTDNVDVPANAAASRA